MTMVYKNSRFQVHMRGGELLGNVGVKRSETLVTPLERRVAIKASWEKTMHTNASKSNINATERVKLEVVLAEGAEKLHPDTAEKLLIHLMQIHRYNASEDHSHVVAIDTEFGTNHNARGDRRPILRLVGFCYTDVTGQATMFSVDMKEVDEINEGGKM